jgi:hypothetical protein
MFWINGAPNMWRNNFSESCSEDEKAKEYQASIPIKGKDMAFFPFYRI